MICVRKHIVFWKIYDIIECILGVLAPIPAADFPRVH